VTVAPGYVLKLHRAVDLFDLIKEHSGDFAEHKLRYTADPIVIGTDEWEILKWDIIGDTDPLLGVVVGELIHDIRSALDQVIYELVGAEGNDPGEHTQFPIYDSETKWRQDILERDPSDRPSPIAGVSDCDFALIDAAQPYHSTKKKRTRHPLMLLLRMSNIDKHRALHVVTVNAHAPKKVSYQPPGYVAVMKKQFKHPGVLVQKGTEMGRVKRRIIRLPPPGTEVVMRITGGAEFAFGKSGEPPIATLSEVGQMIDKAREAILNLRPDADLNVLGLPHGETQES